MPAEGVKMNEPARRKVYVEGVPFTELALTNEDTIRLYDTSGPGSEPEVGLAPVRQDWILGRGDVEEYEGRRMAVRDDGRGAVRRGGSELTREGRPPLRARPGRRVTQLHYARRGEVTPEMEFVARREGVEPELVRSEVARGRAIVPANVNHPESEPMVIGRNF